MSRLIWPALTTVIALSLAGITHGQAPTPSDGPAALHREVQQLEGDIAAIDAEIRALEHQIDRAQQSSENCEFVIAHNDAVIQRLEEWVEAK